MKPDAPMRVLLVDDHEHVLWGLRKLIDGEWPRMMVDGTARTIDEAFAAIAGHKWDVIVLDILLGSENSLDHLEELRARSGAKVVVLTGVHDTRQHQRAIALGAAAVVTKDACGDVLLAAIERAHPGCEVGERAP